MNLDRTSMNESVFRYEVKLGGADLTGEQRSKLLEIAKGCAVRRTLSRPIRFESGTENQLRKWRPYNWLPLRGELTPRPI